MLTLRWVLARVCFRLVLDVRARSVDLHALQGRPMEQRTSRTRCCLLSIQGAAFGARCGDLCGVILCVCVCVRGSVCNVATCDQWGWQLNSFWFVLDCCFK